MAVMTAQQAKTTFGELLLTAQREPVEISKNGKLVAVVLSVQDYTALKHNILRAEIDKGLADVEAGRVISSDDYFSGLRNRLGRTGKHEDE